ncbi:MAG TPA: D-tyrosyl-tRNA(Tyr) deacylase [Gammaproteobacteria bacterium]|nr:D-tyrosyl-tRNA(Tyr) deacylase [Gammaproteobacteria bacterium]
MIGLLQRVSEASVYVDGERVGCIDQGLLVFVGIEREDTKAIAVRLLERILAYRVFADDSGRMNLSVRNVAGGLLLVPQFTLVADTRKGARPSFSHAASPALGRELFAEILTQARQRYAPVAAGVFAADMQISLLNDGPVTFWLQVSAAD